MEAHTVRFESSPALGGGKAQLLGDFTAFSG
jgi:hypothetical protein